MGEGEQSGPFHERHPTGTAVRVLQLRGLTPQKIRPHRVQGHQRVGQSRGKGVSEDLRQLAHIPATLHRRRIDRRQQYPTGNAQRSKLASPSQLQRTHLIRIPSYTQQSFTMRHLDPDRIEAKIILGLDQLPQEGILGRAMCCMSQWLAHAKKQYYVGGITSTTRITMTSPKLLRLPSKSHSKQQPRRRVRVMTRQKCLLRWRWYLTSLDITLCSYSLLLSSSSISFSPNTRCLNEAFSSLCLSFSWPSSQAIKKHWCTAHTVIPNSTASSVNLTGITPKKMIEMAQQTPSVSMLKMKYFAVCSRRNTSLRNVMQRISNHIILPNRPTGLMPTPRASAQIRSSTKHPTEATKRAISNLSQLEYCVRVSSRTYMAATYPSARRSTPKRRQFWQTGKDCTSKASPASPIIIQYYTNLYIHDHSLGPLRLWVRICRTFLMNSIVYRYLSLLTSEALCTIRARSLVMKPRSTVSITLRSKVWAKTVSWGVLSSLARWRRPLVHAKMLAIEFVEVSFPCCHCLK